MFRFDISGDDCHRLGGTGRRATSSVNNSDAKIAARLAWSRTNHVPKRSRKVRVTRKIRKQKQHQSSAAIDPLAEPARALLERATALMRS
jgi:hypothetical protein